MISTQIITGTAWGGIQMEGQVLGDNVAMAVSHYGDKNDYNYYGFLWWP